MDNGISSDFWHDPWLGPIPLCIKFKRLYDLDNFKFSTVASHFNNTGWVWLWRRNIRGGAEETQLLELHNLLSSVTFNDQDDSLWWDTSQHGLYNVSDARRFIDAVDHAPFNVTTIWCKVVPIKVNIFIWRLRLHRLATLRNLEARGLVLTIHIVAYATFWKNPTTTCLFVATLLIKFGVRWGVG
ncbi:uncharacterized protein [Rutidosis leptorrhynchoides]|uniref:uncharacterized protein n=1 Tax=Rutidosis leptorrhynchoides TaxID=125765 RepID=UPI003A997A4E